MNSYHGGGHLYQWRHAAVAILTSDVTHHVTCLNCVTRLWPPLSSSVLISTEWMQFLLRLSGRPEKNVRSSATWLTLCARMSASMRSWYLHTSGEVFIAGLTVILCSIDVMDACPSIDAGQYIIYLWVHRLSGIELTTSLCCWTKRLCIQITHIVIRQNKTYKPTFTAQPKKNGNVWIGYTM